MVTGEHVMVCYGRYGSVCAARWVVSVSCVLERVARTQRLALFVLTCTWKRNTEAKTSPSSTDAPARSPPLLARLACQSRHGTMSACWFSSGFRVVSVPRRILAETLHLSHAARVQAPNNKCHRSILRCAKAHTAGHLTRRAAKWSTLQHSGRSSGGGGNHYRKG